MMLALLFAAHAAVARPKPRELALGDESLMDMTSCIVRREMTRPRKFLSLEPGSKAERVLYDGIMDGNLDCLTTASELRSSMILFRGGLARALYISGYGLGGPPRPEPLGFVLPTFATDDPDIKPEQRQRTRLLYAFGMCVVSANPSDAHDLVVSKPGSPNEKASLASLARGFGPCLPENLKASFNVPSLRALFAVALYNFSARPSVKSSGIH